MKENYTKLLQETKKFKNYLEKKQQENLNLLTDDDEGLINSIQILLLKNSEKEKLEEILMNLENFILYKQNFGK